VPLWLDCHDPINLNTVLHGWISWRKSPAQLLSVLEVVQAQYIGSRCSKHDAQGHSAPGKLFWQQVKTGAWTGHVSLVTQLWFFFTD